jgi:hypothetical protein
MGRHGVLEGRGVGMGWVPKILILFRWMEVRGEGVALQSREAL